MNNKSVIHTLNGAGGGGCGGGGGGCGGGGGVDVITYRQTVSLRSSSAGDSRLQSTPSIANSTKSRH